MTSAFMRRVAAVLVAAVVAACSPTGPTNSNDNTNDTTNNNNNNNNSSGGTSTLRWQLEDGCSDGLGVWVRFFDEVSLGAWPNYSEVYTTSPAGTVDRSLSCTTGNKICYGAQPASSSSTYYWGVGVNNDKGCDNCCFSCTTTLVSRRLTC